ncbi:FAD/NAD(P)-binding domain-containing protein [Laetiporus sulphureus 93-53]|uniref:FAD/NAD(P)-binding domain-containing protein n=1 Tax=Laetiporus sulphureus 93-53 TaxID=1314785 RepID=A0A165GHR4_9APHY|nr:FAD/NAD(P)-binding domain-containing protein [Laetiporus sulphureus 93-53]KZT10366.1 FAD/NAD(P)-binding domain-containing protein [Laetiporus sulphureus 93-53]
MSIHSFPDTVDVLIIGGGPTSLITTSVLLKNGVKVLAVEQYDRAQQALYGRACVLYSRSLELLDMNGLYETIADTGFITRSAVTVKEGQVVPMRGWHFVQEEIDGNTFFDFCLNIRQKYVEDGVGGAVKALDPNAFRSPVKLIDYVLDKSSDYPVTATLELKDGERVQVRSKWLVGADGGRSTIRSLSNIAFPGIQSPHKWVRLDAIVKTDLPGARRTAVAIENKVYGNVLWLPVDNGRTRIGFVINDEIYGTDGKGVTAEIIMEEAKKALAPNKLEFVQLDWWTVYAIGQRVAETYRKGPVILAGDAAHTHSSGAAQGMNTGIHDATNLAWKLSGVVNGWYKEEVLDTYEAERRASAQHLIELDRDVSSLISGKIPDHFHAPPDADFNDYLDLVFRESAGFTVGLGISYPENLLNLASPSNKPYSSVTVGHRAPDAPVFRPGHGLPQRLQELAASSSRRFTLLIFAGKTHPVDSGARLDEASAEKYRKLREYIDSVESFTRNLADVFQSLTILRGEGALQPAETLGVSPLGKVVYDQTGEAYSRYGVDPAEGAIVVLRPDEIVGFVAPVTGWDGLAQYFGRFVQSVNRRAETAQQEFKHAVGELSVEGQEESTKHSSL